MLFRSLVDRFEGTEAFAKQQLNLPLAAIFAHSHPRKKHPVKAGKSQHSKISGRRLLNLKLMIKTVMSLKMMMIYKPLSLRER